MIPMADGRSPDPELQRAAIAAYAYEVAARDNENGRQGQTRLAEEMAAKLPWAPTQQAISQVVRMKRIGFGMIDALLDFLGITKAELLKRHGQASGLHAKPRLRKV